MAFAAVEVKEDESKEVLENAVSKGSAVWCSVLQCVTVCCSVLLCVAVCCFMLQCVAVLKGSATLCCSVV